MPRLIKRGLVIDDGYALLREAGSLADLPEATPGIVSLALWTAARAVLIARGDAGVWLAPADDPAALAAEAPNGACTRVANTSVRFARLPLLARTTNGSNTPPADVRPS